MKPSFALNLNLDSVCLLRRAKGGWRIIGEVALDDPELAQNLSYLRRTATDLSGGQFACKLVIPNAQILYRKFDALGATDARREMVIRGALEGATPYAVDDLVFDWCDAGSGWAHVAAVARDTLDEAEAFATEHRFNPVSFVALPEAGLFDGEPYFGQSRLSETLLPEDDRVERDSAPLNILGQIEAPEMAAADGSKVSQESQDDTTPQVAPAEDVNAADSSDAPVAPTTDASSDSEAGETEDALPFSTKRSGTVPFKTRHGSQLDKIKTRIALKPDAKLAGDDDQPQNPPTARRKVEVSPMPVTDPSIAGDELPPPAKKSVAKARKNAAPKAPSDAGTKSADAPVAGLSAQREVANQPKPRRDAEAEARAMTIFGARRKDTNGGRPRYFGLGLTLGVATLMVLAALVSGYLVGAPITSSNFWRTLTGSSDLSGEAPETVTSTSDVEDITTKVALSGTLQPAPSIDTNVASLATPEFLDADPRFLTPEEAAEAGPEIGTLQPLTLEAATAIYATSGVWPYAPVPPVDLDSDRIDNLYIASIDRRVIVVDAVALPGGGSAAPDDGFLQVLSPPPAGTTYDLDERGFVRARPDGAFTPEGILVFSGSPAVIPILRPGTAEIVGIEEIVPVRLAAVRPFARPENLVELNERVRFGGLSRLELAAVRPVTRPASPQDGGTGVDLSPTANAVLSSRSPTARPGNFAQVVAKAGAAQAASAASDSVVVASVAAAPRAPAIASGASVAHAATVVNAINLSTINLIGVYGSQADRRALVRLKSGRYVKVEVGDRLDGGLVAAIGPVALIYVKNGRTLTLELPKG